MWGTPNKKQAHCYNNSMGSEGQTYALILQGLVPSAPPTTEILLILTSDVNLSQLIPANKSEHFFTPLGKKNNNKKKKNSNTNKLTNTNEH